MEKIFLELLKHSGVSLKTFTKLYGVDRESFEREALIGNASEEHLAIMVEFIKSVEVK